MSTQGSGRGEKLNGPDVVELDAAFHSDPNPTRDPALLGVTPITISALRYSSRASCVWYPGDGRYL